MGLVSQLFGVLAAGGLAVVFARRMGVEGRRQLCAVAIVPLVVAGLVVPPALWDAASSLLDHRDVNARLTAEQAQVQGGAAAGVDVAFLEWAEARLADGDTFHLTVGDPEEAPGDVQWSLFQLGPNLAVDAPADADWLVFYDVGPEVLRGASSDALEVYAPGFAIARSSRAP